MLSYTQKEWKHLYLICARSYQIDSGVRKTGEAQFKIRIMAARELRNREQRNAAAADGGGKGGLGGKAAAGGVSGKGGRGAAKK
jgi:hypothetical protein